MSVRIKRLYRSAGLKPPNGKGIHTARFHRCVISVKKSGRKANPYAVCMSRIGRNRSVKKLHR